MVKKKEGSSKQRSQVSRAYPKSGRSAQDVTAFGNMINDILGDLVKAMIWIQHVDGEQHMHKPSS